MNPLTKVKLINELNEKEAHLGIKDSVSWHAEYKDSAWIFIGGFPYELTEGDIICVFSQYGEIANINLVRDKKTGKSKGFCFLCYEDQRSTVLAVDNFNGIKIKGRTLRVDHVSNYRPPKDSEDIDDVTKRLREEGCAPKTRFSSGSESEDEGLSPVKKAKKDKKEKKKKKKREKKEKKKEAREERRAAQTDRLSPSTPAARVKKEKEDTGYEKYGLKGAQESGGQEARNSRERQEDQQQHGNPRRGERERERDKEDERRTGKSRDEARGREAQRPREERERERDRGRECDRERVRDRVKDRYRERDGENERHHRDGEIEKRRDRDSDRRN
ncbi:RNA-binding motif protein, X-linked 2 [Ictalurus furcatus]|uniref:RNA-binding motif protein, X-linked 2 n=1 Tax=Ictalurus furcatus TaxID=66913 RepID=UPI0023510329|nr:RNA-binding motif protein, X-linked 2 [Ictalurus furcatus]